ncbi:MAG: SPOR domain-containing protein [Thermoleophilia bacterium]|nr:SPOR domain-containing protein [Thermoleophilia bacterium]
MNARQIFPLLLIAATGCDFSGSSNPVKEAFAAAPREYREGTTVAFRFPTARGRDARLYQLPTLDDVRWRFETGRSSAKQMVGFAADRDILYFLTDADYLAALDLATGRTRLVDSNVVSATMTPAAIPLIVHRDGSIASVELRSVVPWATPMSAKPSAVWGTVRNGLLALVEKDGSATLHLYRQGQTPVVQPAPNPAVIVSTWGDAALALTDSGLYVLEPADPKAATFLPVKPRPTLATFSASGHRIYVVREDLRLVAFDRYTHQPVAVLALPGPTDASRSDPTGRFLLLRPVEGVSVWLVDLARWTAPQVVPAEWDETFPLVAPDGTLLVRRGDRVEALSPDSLTTLGAVTSRSDRWIVLSWDPRRLNLEAAVTAGREPELGGQLIYIQVSSTSNPDWAADLAGNLRRAGMSATVLPPDRPGEPYRVVLGPYPNRDEAEATGRQLGLPFWIFRRDTTSLNR